MIGTALRRAIVAARNYQPRVKRTVGCFGNAAPENKQAGSSLTRYMMKLTMGLLNCLRLRRKVLFDPLQRKLAR
jgi:hypothetical protein